MKTQCLSKNIPADSECKHEFVDWAINAVAGTQDNIEMCVKCGEIKDPDNLLGITINCNKLITNK